MNIAILIPELGGGGAERVAQILGDYYTGQGNRVYYFVGELHGKPAYPVKGTIVKTGIKSCIGGSHVSVRNLVELLRAACKMKKFKEMYQVHVAVSFMEEFNCLNVLSKGKEKVIARVCTILSERKELEGFLYRKRVIHFIYSHADQTVVMSRYAWKDMLRNYGVPCRKLIRIPNPVQDLEKKENGNVWGFGAKAVVCVGRLEAVKQQERIIRAFSYVHKKEPGAKLLILGKGSQLGYLKHMCRECQVEEDVAFVGFTDNLPYYLEKARAFVMASKVEGFPNSMLEAMHYGLPIITTDAPGACREILGKAPGVVLRDNMEMCRYGILTPPMPEGKPKAGSPLDRQELILGEAMQKILDEDEVYNTYREQSYKRAAMFSVEKVVRKWNAIIGAV